MAFDVDETETGLGERAGAVVELEAVEVAVARGELSDVLDGAVVPGLVDVEVVGEEVDVFLSSSASVTPAILLLSSA